jgi:hypothetical protein
MLELDKDRISDAGEYYAAAKLSAMGYTVTVALGNNQGFDLHVSDGKKAIMVQVKGAEGPLFVWPVQWIEKAEPNLVYIFVNLNPSKDCPRPSFHIAKSKVVKEQMEKERDECIERLIREGKEVKEDGKGVSHFKDPERKYMDKWKTLGLKDPVQMMNERIEKKKEQKAKNKEKKEKEAKRSKK